MAVTPLGSVIYTNQNMNVVTQKQADFQNRVDVQNTAAGVAANEKERLVNEIRPTEETHKIDPEKEHEKKKREQENPPEDEKKKKDSDEANENKTTLNHILDISV